jgi:hypothetical protein
MDERVPGGAFLIARKIFNSAIWSKPPLYLKVWLWILGQASYTDHTAQGQNFRRGEFVTTREKIIKANGYRHNRRVIFPTLKQVRDILSWLVSEGMIIVEPIRGWDLKNTEMQGPERLGRTRADTGSRTWAYLGILISVVNYESYQTIDTYTRADTWADHPDELGPVHKKGLRKKRSTPAFADASADLSLSTLRERYPDQDLLNRVFQAIVSTRKCGKVKDTVLVAQLMKWQRYPVAQVEAGLRIYLEKDYAGQGKGEGYLLGIIRNHKLEAPRRESTGSTLLDWASAQEHLRPSSPGGER